jgi:hypothetical protein
MPIPKLRASGARWPKTRLSLNPQLSSKNFCKKSPKTRPSRFLYPGVCYSHGACTYQDAIGQGSSLRAINPISVSAPAVGLPRLGECFRRKIYFLPNEPKVVQCLPRILKNKVPANHIKIVQNRIKTHLKEPETDTNEAKTTPK